MTLAKDWGRQRSPQNSSLGRHAATFLPRPRLETNTCGGAGGGGGEQESQPGGISLSFPGRTVLPEETGLLDGWAGQARPEAAGGQALRSRARAGPLELPGDTPFGKTL